MSKLVWMEIPELPGYKINAKGQVLALSINLIRKWVFDTEYMSMIVFIKGKRKKIKEHQIVVRFRHPTYRLFQGYKYVIDHINSIKIDNRYKNLRVCSPRENVVKELELKRPIPVGVHYNKKLNKYCGQITIENSKYHLGVYDTPQLAKEAYEAALKNYLYAGVIPPSLRNNKHKRISYQKQSQSWRYRMPKKGKSKFFKTEQEAVEYKNKVECLNGI
jgi:hypothetical protein